MSKQKWVQEDETTSNQSTLQTALTFISPSADLGRPVVSNWRKYVHLVLVDHLKGLSLPRNCMVRLTDRPDMTRVVYSVRKATKLPP